jgi:hypothetical protein
MLTVKGQACRGHESRVNELDLWATYIVDCHSPCEGSARIKREDSGDSSKHHRQELCEQCWCEVDRMDLPRVVHGDKWKHTRVFIQTLSSLIRPPTQPIGGCVVKMDTRHCATC